MRAVKRTNVCDGGGVNHPCLSGPVCLVGLLLIVAGVSARAQETNKAATTDVPAPVREAPKPTQAAPVSPATQASTQGRPESRSSQLDESAFRLVGERNIFNANRSGGQVRLSSRRASRVESFTLVGTIAYEKGAFAFFQGSNSELTKVLKPEGTIAGHKLVDIFADGVKLEVDGKVLELAVGSAMRREDEGAWRPGEAVAGSTGGSSRGEDDDASRSRESEDRRSGSSSTSPSTAQSDNHRQERQDRKDEKKEAKLDAKAEADILKRLMERRERESQ